MKNKFNIAKDAAGGLTTVILFDNYLNYSNPSIHGPVMDILRAATHLTGNTPDAWRDLKGYADAKKAAEAVFTGKISIKAAFTSTGLSPVTLEPGIDLEKARTAWHKINKNISSEDELHLSIDNIRKAAAGTPLQLIIIACDPAEDHFTRDQTNKNIDALLADNPYSTVSVLPYFQKELEKKPCKMHPKMKLYSRDDMHFSNPTGPLIRTCVKAHEEYLLVRAKTGFPTTEKIGAPEGVTISRTPVKIKL